MKSTALTKFAPARNVRRINVGGKFRPVFSKSYDPRIMSRFAKSKIVNKVIDKALVASPELLIAGGLTTAFLATRHRQNIRKKSKVDFKPVRRV